MKRIKFKGKVKGIVEGNWYISKRRPEHFMKKFQGFGVSKQILLQLQEMGIQNIRIIYEGKRGVKVFESTVKAYLESDLIHIDGGKDKQKFLSIKQMGDKYGNAF